MADSDLWGDLGYKPPGQPQQASATQAPPDPELKALVASKAAQYGIPGDIADRWVQQESSYNPKATSKKGARGLTQLMPKTAETYGVDDVEDPKQNVEAGAHYLADLKAQFGSWDKALAAYNAGPDAVSKANGIPDIPETQNYVKTIMGDGAPSDDLWGQLGYKPASAPSPDDEAQFTAEHPKMVSPGDLKPADLKTYKTLLQGGLLKPDQPYGGEHNPFFNTEAKQVPPGAYYVADGKVQRAPGGPKESSALAGLGQGVGDVITTLSHAIPGTDDSDIKNTLVGSQMLYGAKYGGDLKSGAGRFTGQLVGSAPLLSAGGAVAAPILRAAGPVGAFLAGQAGRGAPGLGGLLLRGGSLAASGAATGAGAAGLTASANEGSVPDQMIAGAAGGALAGPLAPAAERAGRAVFGAGKALLAPLSYGGREGIVDTGIGKFTGGKPLSMDLRPLVPGSEPTAAEAAGNAGLSVLEKKMRANPTAGIGQQFAERLDQNNEARLALFSKLKGDEHSVQALEDAREAATGGAREAALKAQSQPADLSPVLGKIDEILKGPEGKRTEVVKALTAVRDNLHDAQGNPETSAAMLYGVRKDINDLLSPKASSEKKGAQLAASELKTVRDALDGAIQDVAPGFKEYLKTYADMSKPINEQTYLQGLHLTTNQQGREVITLSKVQSALDKINDLRKKGGVNDAKSIAQGTIDQLTALRDDLKRAGNIDLGKPRGSDTDQNLIAGNLASEAGVPLSALAAVTHHPIGAAAFGAGKLFYGMKEKQVLQQLADRLLTPNQAPAAPVVRNKLIGPGTRRVLKGAVPAAGGILANRMVAQ